MSGKGWKLVLAVALCGPASALALGAESAPDATYQRLCAECHPRAERLATRFGAVEPAETEARWQAFLRRHHAPDAADRHELMRFFESVRAVR